MGSGSVIRHRGRARPIAIALAAVVLAAAVAAGTGWAAPYRSDPHRAAISVKVRANAERIATIYVGYQVHCKVGDKPPRLLRAAWKPRHPIAVGPHGRFDFSNGRVTVRGHVGRRRVTGHFAEPNPHRPISCWSGDRRDPWVAFAAHRVPG